MNATVSFLTPVQEDINAVEAIMRSQAKGYHSDLNAALTLLLSAGGKRIRPALTILVGRMLGANHDHLLSLAAAIELLHTATLVHDDLIDGSLLRRGMPTLNSHWSPGATVLTGDFIFSRAANMAANTDSIPAMKLFSRTLTIIVNGEINQLFGSRCKVNLAEYQSRIYAKTASLFETSAHAAALISCADEKTSEILRLFGYNIGMSFQIIDDILDFTGEQATIGKPVGSDLRQGLVTLPAIFYAQSHPDDPNAAELLNGDCLTDAKQIETLVESIRRSESIQASHQQAKQYIQTALDNIQKLPSSPERCSLEEMANYIVEREL